MEMFRNKLLDTDKEQTDDGSCIYNCINAHHKPISKAGNKRNGKTCYEMTVYNFLKGSCYNSPRSKQYYKLFSLFALNAFSNFIRTLYLNKITLIFFFFFAAFLFSSYSLFKVHTRKVFSQKAVFFG